MIRIEEELVREIAQLRRRIDDLGRRDGTGIVKLASVVLAGAQASIDFQDIPANFAHLAIESFLRTDRVATGDAIYIRFNNDSGNNYDSFVVDISHPNTMATAEGLAITGGYLYGSTAANAPANEFAPGTIKIPNYAHTGVKKSWHSEGHEGTNTTTGQLRFRTGGGTWKISPIAAINRVTLVSANGANFVAGSVATLYLMP